MDKNKKCYYNLRQVAINNNLVYGCNKVGFSIIFNLNSEQVFCSCSIQMNVHREDCPNAHRDRFIRYIKEKEEALG